MLFTPLAALCETPAKPIEPDQEIQAFDVDDLTAAIDDFVARRWQEQNVTPAAPVNDRAFARRVYLDLTGRIPTVDEMGAFVGDSQCDRRRRLVDRLLASDDYAVHMADVFDALLMGRGDERDYQKRAENHWRAYLERKFRDNRPWNEIAREVLLARPTDDAQHGATWFLFERKNNHQEIAEAIAPAFFGLRVECAQCHDHPLAYEIEQRHYWGLVAYFRRGKNTGTKHGPRVAESAVGGFEEFADLSGDSYPNLLSFVDAETIEEPRPGKDEKQEDSEDLYEPGVRDGDPRVPRFSRRKQFVDRVLADHPRLALAMVNRMWALLLGRGIVHPFDEMDSEHPPSHPELLEHLAADFRQSGYDVKRLIRAIVLSDMYQLDSRGAEGTDDPADFARHLEKGLTAEQYARSLALLVRGTKELDGEIIAAFREQFADVLPDENVTLVKQALFLSNNAALDEYLRTSREPEHLAPQLAKLETDEARVENLFRRALGRAPTDEETSAAAAYLANRPDLLESALDELIWAVVTSAEFRFNH